MTVALKTMTAEAQERFLEMLPSIRRVGNYAFRQLSRSRREELIAEVVASAFVTFARLVELGRADVAYATVLARFAVRRIRNGRFVACKQNARDVLSPYAQRTKGFTMKSLHVRSDEGQWQELVMEDRHSTPAEVAVTRLDFAAWLEKLDRTRGAVALRLAQGDCAADTAQKCQLSPGRISQIRGELKDSWQAFQGEIPALGAA